MEQFRICNDCDFSGVYAIVNIDKQKTYIGSSKNIKKRLKSHKSQLKNNRSTIKNMQYDYNKGDKFIAYVITPAAIGKTSYRRDNELRHFEYMAIEQFETANPDKGYNKRKDHVPKLVEESNIYFANLRLQGYFDDSRYSGKYMEEAKIDEREFLDHVLFKEGRF